MTEPEHGKRVLAIAPGAAFLRTVTETLCNGTLAPSWRYDPADPLSLARVTIFVPTRRSARVLRSEFVDFLGGKSAILPIIRPLGEADDDSGFFDAAMPEILDLAPPVSGTARLLELARLILAWRNSLPAAISDVHSESPLVAPASPADAVWLARALGEIIDDMDTEERDWSELAKLDTTDHARWWQLTAEFLKIASEFWPARLAEINRSSAIRHMNSVLRSESRRMEANAGTDPVIVAGSTGSIPAAADLIATVARMPNGVVVLPGLDRTLTESEWQTIGLNPEDPASRTHPQYGLFVLLRKLGLTRKDIPFLGDEPEDLAARAAILSVAMAPAGATDRWNAWRQEKMERAGLENLFEKAFGDAALIEADNEREEATAIAIALRMALDRPGLHGGPSRAALVTPDRVLARRVASELQRFGIIADDSAGTPLSATPQASLLALMLEAILRPGDPLTIVSLLKHPLARFGLDQASFQASATALELLALRGGNGETDIADLEALLERQMAIHAANRHTASWRKSLPADAGEIAAELVRRITLAVEPLASVFTRKARSEGRMTQTRLTMKLDLARWAERTGRVIEAVCTDDRGDLAALWSGEAGDRLAGLLSELIDSGETFHVDGPQWVDIMAALIAGDAVKPRAMSHPRVFIFGAMEARLQTMDMMVLGGMNEGMWPGQTANNPFLSRSMKTAIGLEPPERRIGQLAHDFEMANGTRHIIYSRALRQGSTPAVASRWLQRMMALGGEAFAKKLRARGEQYREWAAMVDDGPSQKPASRPAPKPPAELQPTSYSFSEVGRLRRDPYAIYARRVLKLDPVDAFNRDPDAAERGTIYHRIVERFIAGGHIAGTPAAREAMEQIIDTVFDTAALPAHIDVVWRPRFRAVAARFMETEAERHPHVKRRITEAGAGMDLPGAGLRLTGIADRIDILKSGIADIIDYKTGSSPTVSQARSLLDPQLALEAAALRHGAFRDAGAKEPGDLLYIRLKPGDGYRIERVNNEGAARGKGQPKSAADLAEESLRQLVKFVWMLRHGENGFASRLIPERQSGWGGEYDHLARVAEWSTAGDDDNGGADADG